MTSATPQAQYRKDYQSPNYTINTTELSVQLDDDNSLVHAKLVIEKCGEHQEPMVFDCEVDELLSVKLDGLMLSDSEYQLKDGQLIIQHSKQHMSIEFESRVAASSNTSLEGLYKSDAAYCTQCEAQGFRKITPYFDRPDVLSVFTVTVFADKKQFPYLLANGNQVAQGNVDSSQHWVKWHDPFPKPSYLFALVAGDFDLIQDTFTTQSSREIKLELFVDKGNKHLGPHAMASLKKSMLWDEQRYGLEYDLDIYMIVAVDFFNMGAMENKGLNVFNSKYVLADKQTATDVDYHGIEAVIAHEYFHNWTGNRVTCRDWFQLSLKEGLTVFRDQQFSADMGTEVIERISHANIIRSYQFAEDAGPMSHPIRPDKVIEMNNFYTVTVYDKGAEVIRMLHSLLGEAGFVAGMDLYFERHDGQAVTCDDFVNAMADANSQDLSQFKNWYSQAGTPTVTVIEEHNSGNINLQLSQHINGKKLMSPLVIPVAYQLICNQSGENLGQGTLLFNEFEQTFNLPVDKPATLVLFENFSAPVKVDHNQTVEQLIHIVNYAADPFCRWDAMQSLWLKVCKTELSSDVLAKLVVSILADDSLDIAVKAELVKVPSFSSLKEQFDVIDVDNILNSIDTVQQQVATLGEGALRSLLEDLTNIADEYQQQNIAKRSLKAVVFQYLSHSTVENNDVFSGNLAQCTNMTERMLSLSALRKSAPVKFNKAVEQTLSEFSENPLVFDKMLAQCAMQDTPQIYQIIESWQQHPSFDIKNPNRVRALWSAFINLNPKWFHQIEGNGYQGLVKLIQQVDSMNPQLSANLVTPLLSWKRFAEPRQQNMKQALETIQQGKLSKDLFEKVSAALN